jgi:shikimate dehydrogenase
VRAVLYQAAFLAAGLKVRWESVAVRPDGLAGAIQRLTADPTVLGAALSGEHMTVAPRLCDGLGPDAETSGVVDTISRRAGVLIGWDTQQTAIAHVLADLDYDPRGRNVLVVGTGGPARSLAAMFKPQVERLWIAGAELQAATELCSSLGIEAGGPLPINAIRLILGKANLVVNTIAEPAADLSLPLPAEWLRPHQFVIDLRYNPPLTPLVRAARLRGARAINGLTMLLYQGLGAFEIWTGRPAPEAAMRQALERAAVERLAS